MFFFHANILTIYNEVISLLLTIDPNVLPTGHPYHGFLTQMCVGFAKRRAGGGFTIQVDCMTAYFSLVQGTTKILPWNIIYMEYPSYIECHEGSVMLYKFTEYELYLSDFIFVTLQFAPTKYFSTLRILTGILRTPKTRNSEIQVRSKTCRIFRIRPWASSPLTNPQVKDVSYFSCPANHGIFVRPTQVATSAGGAASPVSPGDEKWKRVKLKPTVDGNQKSGFNSPVEVGSFISITYKVFYTTQRWFAGVLNHQP